MPKDNKIIYSVLEASEKLGISVRAVQKRCKKDDLRKKNNRYVITDAIIEKWQEKAIETNNKNEQFAKNLTSSQFDILELVKSIDNDDYVKTVLLAINENKHLEEFSENEYLRFKKRLEEANYLEKRISDYKEEIKRMEDYVKDYRNTIQYLRVSLDKRADESLKLIESIKERNFIEAKEKNLDNI